MRRVLIVCHFLFQLSVQGQIPVKPDSEALFLAAVAVSNDPKDMTALGACYLYGKEGVPQNFLKAHEWLVKAAATGEPQSQLLLVRMYQSGMGVKKNPLFAKTILTKLANEGNHDAQFELGGEFRMEAAGKMIYGQFDSYAVHSYKWYSLVASSKYELAALAEENRNQLLVDMSPAAINRAQQMVLEFKPKPPSPLVNTNTPAIASTPSDKSKTLEFQLSRAKEGSAQAQYDLGMRYLNGNGVPADSQKAIEWLKKAAAQNHALAKKQLEK